MIILYTRISFSFF